MTRGAGSLLLCLVPWAAGCSTPPRIDTSSEARAGTSLKQVRESLPQEKRRAFDQAVMTVALSRLGEEAPGEVAGPEALGAELLKPLNGMTAAEVLTEARRIAADRREAPGAGQGKSKPPP
jgi:Family of unknown function (DUF6694)